MRFTETALEGVWLVEPVLSSDERGAFGRIWCAEEFAQRGMARSVSQCSVSVNRLTGTLRGMHWQAEPHGEAKLVRVTAGAIFDVAVDIRPGSPTFRRWVSAELSAANRQALYMPPGFAHGFVTLQDDTEVVYQMDAPFVEHAARGFRWDDPAVGIRWPVEPSVMSDRDRNFPSLTV